MPNSISRSAFWIGILTVVLVFGLGRYGLKEHVGAREDLVLVWSVFALLPLTILMSLRLADRRRPLWLALVWGAGTGLTMVAPHFGYLADPATFSPPEHAVFWPLLALTAFVLFEAGFLRARPAGP